jgi:hypothetical protein
MLNAIIGGNAVGKTVYLREMLAKYPIDDVVTNLSEDIDTLPEDADESRVDIINNILFAGLYWTGGQLASDGQCGYDKNTIATLINMCRPGSVFIYDEPDRMVEERAVFRLYDALDEMTTTFKDMWITTHFDGIMDSDVVRLFTIEDGKLREVTKEESFEILGAI